MSKATGLADRSRDLYSNVSYKMTPYTNNTTINISNGSQDKKVRKFKKNYSTIKELELGKQFRRLTSKPKPEAQRQTLQTQGLFVMENRAVKKDTKPSDKMKDYIINNNEY